VALLPLEPDITVTPPAPRTRTTVTAVLTPATETGPPKSQRVASTPRLTREPAPWPASSRPHRAARPRSLTGGVPGPAPPPPST